MTKRSGGLWDWVSGGETAARQRAARLGAASTFLALAGLTFVLPRPASRTVELEVVRPPITGPLFRTRHDPDDPSRRTAVRALPRDEAEAERVLGLAEDVWSEHVELQAGIDVVLRPDDIAALRAAGISYDILVPDIDAAAQVEQMRLQSADAQRPGNWFAEYKDYAAISGYVEGLAAAHPELTSLETIGLSVEGRPLQALRIGGTGPDPIRLAIDGGMHAREWIAMMIPVCVADRLLNGQDDPALRTFVETTQLWVVPVVNPDGYEHTWAGDRYWRKNRRGEHGVDLNRNFEVAWGENGASKDPRSPVYHGPSPFSEPESAALRDLLRREKVEAHIDFHSYSQLILYPWSFTKKAAPDGPRLAAFADRMASAIFATHGERYTIKAGAGLYPASGTAMDWAYGERDTLSFVVELRPRRGSGFVLPPDQIVPTCDESVAAVLALGDAVREHRDRDRAAPL